jgi:ubiquinone/menaquinone biosynthesis C-methylase UbiE
MRTEKQRAIPGGNAPYNRMPGHWVMAQLGKRVLRPGGVALTNRMLNALSIGPQTRVLELAPGMGHTAGRTLALRPASYTAVEQDAAAAVRLRHMVEPLGGICLEANADATGLPDASMDVIYGEAFLTMQSTSMKRRILKEAARVLVPGGCIGFHEICVVPDGIDSAEKQRIQNRLSQVISHTVLPETAGEWRQMLEAAGLTVRQLETAPMNLLEPARFLRDEGLSGTARFIFNLLRRPTARRRIATMRAGMREARTQMRAFFVTAVR